MSDIIAAERCPTCDRRLASLADYAVRRACEDSGGACLCPRDCCWLLVGGGCSQPPIDWRARALAAEAKAALAGFRWSPSPSETE